jgi:N4-gp56 family major capsid protein
MNTVSNSSLRNQLWDKELFADVQRQSFFMNKEMMGESANSIVQVKNDLKKSNGEKINFGLGARLTGDGVVGNAELEGNEEKVNYYQDDVSIDQIRNAVRLDGELDEQKAAHDLRKDAKEKGSTWITEFLENQIFMKMAGVATTTLTRVDGATIYSGRAAWSNTGNAVPTADEVAGYGKRYISAKAGSLTAIAASDVLTTGMITKARIKAELANPKIQPIRINGENFYVMFVHPWQAADLKTASNSPWVAAQQYAAERGKTNPLFSGALGMWDGVILHSHEFVPTAATSAVWVTGATAVACRTFRSVLCGAQSVLMANASKNGKGAAPTYMREETFDYGDKSGFAVGYIGGIQKPTFNSLDYGTIVVESGATVLS